ncbi:MAG: TonB-dependent receptor [Bacteroidales bacterium]
MLRTTILAIILMTIGNPIITAQSGGRVTMAGTVIRSDDSTRVEMVAVVLTELNLWTVTDRGGNFILRGIPAGTHTLALSCLGFNQYEQKLTINSDIQGKILYIDPLTLALDEVVVVAREGRRMATESKIEQSAIQHVQPTDLSDVLQLLPGQITTNPNLARAKQLTIREINAGSDRMASLGTLLIIDGSPVNNDANMQFLKTSGGSPTAQFSTTAAGGSDVRSIPVDNIESVEVIRGIASVENGDMLSGAVKVNLKKGKTPFISKVKIDPGIKQVYFGKGFLLPEGRGSLNTDFDYTQSLDDLRTKYKTFNRLNGSIRYSTTFFKQSKPLTFNVLTRMSQTLDIKSVDPDMLAFEKYESKDQNASLTLSGRWALNSLLISNLNFNLSGTYQHQVGHEIRHISLSGPMPQPVATTGGENETNYLPSRYTSDLVVDGKPYYLNSRLSGTKTFYTGRILHSIMFGTEWKLSGNRGLGRVYDLAFPPSPTGNTDARPRSYRDIPSLADLALYAEENVTIPIGSTKMEIQTGVRFTNVQPETVFRSGENTTMFDPRFNFRYTLVDRSGNPNIKKMILRGGYGYFSKAPPLLYYYPDNAYYDKVSFNYYDTSGDKLVVTTTKVNEDTRNYTLKAALNRKSEAGFDIGFRGVDISVTSFYERMTNGFDFQRLYDLFIYNRYEPLTVGGLAPFYVPGSGVFYNDPVSGEPIAVPAVPDSIFISYNYPTNDNLTIKKGIEFTIDFGNIEKLRTSFILDGAYMNIRRQTVADYLTQVTTSYLGKPFPYVGLYKGGNGSITERLNTNLRTITHIRELRMVFTVTTQVVWMEKSRNIYNSPDGTPLFYTRDPVEDLYTDVEQIKYLDPIGYFDKQLNYHPFVRELATQKPLADLIRSYVDPRYFIQRKFTPYYQINLRLTKEVSDIIDFSFYANNLTNYQPLVRIIGLKEAYARKNSPLYFGAEIRIKF